MATTNLTSFAGQVVLVTGAASGIGKAAAELIAERGGHVVCLDLNEAGLKTTVAEISAAGGKASYKVLDVSSQSGVKKVIAEILAEHGQIHALANSAGISGPTGKPVEEFEWAAFQKTIEINLYGTVWLTQELMPSMKANKYGRIVHLASIAGKEGNPNASAYSTAKAGVIGLTKSLGKELADKNILEILDGKKGIYGHRYNLKDGGVTVKVVSGQAFSARVQTISANLKAGRIKNLLGS